MYTFLSSNLIVSSRYLKEKKCCMHTIRWQCCFCLYIWVLKLKSACKIDWTNHPNKDHQTAEELFATRNEKLHQDARKWLNPTSKNCTILSIFIATVAFIVAYTMALIKKPRFQLFTLALISVGKLLNPYILISTIKLVFPRLPHSQFCST